MDGGHLPDVPRRDDRWPAADFHLHQHRPQPLECFHGTVFPGIGLLAIVFGTKTLASIVKNLFEREILYLISPYDCVAHVGQALIGTQTTYDQYSWTYSLVALVAMNALALYVLASRVASMEVTRE